MFSGPEQGTLEGLRLGGGGRKDAASKGRENYRWGLYARAGKGLSPDNHLGFAVAARRGLVCRLPAGAAGVAHRPHGRPSVRMRESSVDTRINAYETVQEPKCLSFPW